MPRKFPPRGYFNEEYPLPHDFIYKFSLSLENVAKDATICTMFRNSIENTVNPEQIEVNPHKPVFEECNGPTCHSGSIIPKLSFSLNAFMNIASNTDVGGASGPSKPIKFNWAPLYCAFDDIDATDEESNLTVGNIVELEKGGFSEINPTFVSDLTVTSGHASSHPLTTAPGNITDETFDDWELGTDLVMESVAWSKETYFEHIRFGTVTKKLQKVMPRINTGMVSASRPFRYYSNNFTYPSVKRINDFTYCGVMIMLPQAGDTEQPILASEVTDIEHINFTIRASFDEWNPAFDQSAI